MRYEEPLPISRDEAMTAFSSADSELICKTLVRIVFHERDRAWVEAQCLEFLASRDVAVRRCAATCLGTLAVFHRKSHQSILLRLKAMRDEPDVGGAVEDAISDIERFAPRS